MAGLTQVSKHVHDPAVHWTQSPCQQIFINGLIPKVEIPCIPVVGKAIRLNSIPYPLELAATCLVFTLTLHLTGLLVAGELLPQAPRLLPNITTPTKQFINLEVWALVLWRLIH
jgi:hypothetical protein